MIPNNTIQPPAKGNLKISYSVLGIGFIILLIVLGILICLNQGIGLGIKLTEFISIASFGCVTIGLIYNAVSLQYNYQINKQKFEREDELSRLEKVKFTYQVISDWYKADMAMNAERTRRFVRPFKGQLSQPARLQEFKLLLAQDDNLETRKSLISVLNYYESLALLAFDKVIDEDILCKSFKTGFVTYYDNLKEYIEDEQRGNGGANAKIFINFVTLTKKWLHN
jgi:hypothetical protein